MKKISLIALTALAVFSISCSKDIETPSQDTVKNPKVLYATTDDDFTTKTSLDGKSVIWTSSDVISAFDDEGTNHQSTKTEVSNSGKDALFEVGSISVEDDVMMALYPYDENATFDTDDYSIETTIPTVQNIVVNSFANGANVAIAEGLTNKLKFRNVGAFLCLSIANDNVKSVKLSSNTTMTGNVVIDYNGGEPELIFDESKVVNEYVELKGDFVKGEKYYFVVAPGEYNELTITLTDKDGKTASLSNPATLKIKRNENLFIGDLPVIPENKWEGEIGYKKISSQSDIIDGGVYLIVCESQNTAMGSQNTNRRNNAAVTIKDGIIIPNGVNEEDKPYEVTLTKNGDVYNMVLSNGKYLGNGTTSNYLKEVNQANTGYGWSFTYTSNAVTMKTNHSTPRILCVNTSNADSYATYTSLDSYEKVTFYKKTIVSEGGDSGEGGNEGEGGDSSSDVLAVDFEGETSTYSDWKFTNITTQKADSNVPAHGGSFFGTTDGKTTGSVQTKNKVASPGIITFYISKTTTNTTSSSWIIQTSSDGSSWEEVKTASASSTTRGEWTKVSQDLSTYSNVYVRVYYEGTTAVRCIDDLTLTYTTPQTYTITIANDIKNGTVSATPLSTTAGETITLSEEPATGYEFDSWIVTNAITNAKITVTDNKFTMPAANVNVSAAFKEKTSTTGTIKFGTNDVKINEASVTANDNLGNSWTITTIGTSSFTANSDYYQVGSSKSPATSITFTTTLPEEVKVNVLSAKFGGFSDTAGAITLKVGDTTIGTDSLKASNDVTVSSTSSANGTVLTVTVAGIAKGVKVYNISYTYEAITSTQE